MNQDKLKYSLQALEAVKTMLSSPALSSETCRKLKELKRTLELEIEAMTCDPADGDDDDGAAA